MHGNRGLKAWYRALIRCFKRTGQYSHIDSPPSFLHSAGDDVIPDFADGLIWGCALARHTSGDFSYAVVRANSPCEDRSEVEAGLFGTFLGIYDGHGGPQAAQFINENMFNCFLSAISEIGGVTVESLNEAVQSVEHKFLEVVRSNWPAKPQLAATGACVLMGVLAESMLHVVSLGDSKAVLGRRRSIFLGGGTAAQELSTEHSANNVIERESLKRRRPQEKDIVVDRGGVWRVKGIIQVTRSIGDFYLKLPEFQRPPLNPRFLLPTELKQPALSAEPSISSHQLTPSDLFAIFASDGLWDQVKPAEASSIVAKNPRMGIARRLVKVALSRACRVHQLKISQLPRVDPAQRRQVHDDITVVVLFFHHETGLWATAPTTPMVAAKGPIPSSPSWARDAPPKAGGARALQPSESMNSGSGLIGKYFSIKGQSEFSPEQLLNQLRVDPVPDSVVK